MNGKIYCYFNKRKRLHKFSQKSCFSAECAQADREEDLL